VFLRDAMGFLLVFDLTNERSLTNCREWLQILSAHAYCEKPDVVLVGNKADLDSHRAVSVEQAEKMAKELGLVIFKHDCPPCSATKIQQYPFLLINFINIKII